MQALHVHDVDGGEDHLVATAPAPAEEADLPLEERLRRERLRMRATGITSFAFDRTGEHVLLPIGGGVFVGSTAGWPAGGTDLRELVPAKGGVAVDPTFSPDGRHVRSSATPRCGWSRSRAGCRGR